MQKVVFFNKEIEIREHYCQLNSLPSSKIEEPYVNIYISITNVCNASCAFCCSKKVNKVITNFDFEKFKEIILEINKKVRINKCSFTGGEPTLEFQTLIKCLEFVKSIDKNIFTVINTNGINLNKLSPYLHLINSIALSRHHYNDETNFKIFNNFNLPITEDISEFPDKSKLHLSCNLIKEYVGNPQEVVNYLEWVSTIGCYDVGFVSLMQVNNYCKNNFVDFKSLSFEDINNVFITKNWNFGNLCRCRNYNYISQNAEIIDVYSRYYVSPTYNGSALVFDGEYLRLGFDGEIVY